MSAPFRLLSREEFKKAVFDRDRHICVVCGAPAADAHHILDRKLFPDGGYYLENGSSLCQKDHLEAEMSTLSVEDIRKLCGITSWPIPPGLDRDRHYDKWGNEILADGRREPGPMFHDDGARKILAKAGFLYDGTFPL